MQLNDHRSSVVSVSGQLMTIAKELGHIYMVVGCVWLVRQVGDSEITRQHQMVDPDWKLIVNQLCTGRDVGQKTLPL